MATTKRRFRSIEIMFSDREFDDVFKALRHYGRELRVFLSDVDEGDDVASVQEELERINDLIERFADLDESEGA